LRVENEEGNGDTKIVGAALVAALSDSSGAF
jgi:hypothetical protein